MHMGRKKEGVTDSVSTLESLVREFGSPVRIPEGELAVGKTYKQGAVCPENPNCRLVNTRACNYTGCIKRSTRGKLE